VEAEPETRSGQDVNEGIARPTSFRLTTAARDLLVRIAKKEGISRAAVIEGLIRRKAEAMNLTGEAPASGK